MKILYIASERSRAQVATRALRTAYPNVSVLWGSSFERAAFAILENPDLAALIVEVQSDSHGCAYLKQMRTVGLQAPVVMVLPEGAGTPIESLKAGANGYVAKGPSFSQELPVVVTRTIGGGQAPAESAVGVPVDRRTRRDVTSTSETRQPPRAPAVTNGGELKTAFHQREQHSAIEQSAAAARQANLEKLLHQEREIRAGLEQKLAELKAALQGAEQRHLSATSAAAAQLAERTTQYETGLSRAAATQKTLEEQLRQFRQSRASAVAEVDRLTQRNAELNSMLTEASATRNRLEGRLTEIETALNAANDRASLDQQAGARESELHARLEQEIEKRRNVEEDLARAKTAHQDAEKQRSSVVEAATALWAERQAQFDAEMAKAVEGRNTLGREARGLEEALHQAQQTLQTHATEVERLTQREVELTSQLAEATAMRSTLERQLSDAASAAQAAGRGALRDHLAANTQAAEREVEFDRLIRHEHATRADVEQRLARAEAALREAKQQHATEVERLTLREVELTSQLSEAAAMRSTLEQQLVDAATALKDADEGASQDRLAAATRAAERELELGRLLRQERATRADVEQRLAELQAALREAEQQHTLAMTAAASEQTARQAQFDAELGKAVEARTTLGREARELEVTLHQARQSLQAHATEVERLTQHEAELASQLTEAAAIRSTLEWQLTDAASSLKDANDRATRDRAAAATRTAEREAELDGLIRQERAMRADVEQRLARVENDLRDTEQQHASALTAAATERAECQAQFETELAHMAAARDEFTRRFNDAETALLAARQEHAAATTEVQRLTEREAALTTQLTEAAATRSTLESQLTDAASSLKDANDRATRDRAAAATRAAEREAELDGLIRQERTTRADVEQRLSQVEATLRDAEHQHASAMRAAATERAEREAQFETELSETAAARDEFKRRFSDAETALASTRRDHAAAATEVERLTQREAALASQVAQVEVVLREAQQQHASAMTVAATERAERQTQFEAELAQMAAARDDFRTRLHEAEIAARDAEHRHASAMAAAATERVERQMQFEAELAQTAGARDDFKHRWSNAETALATARHDHAGAATEVERLTQREAELRSQLAEANAVRSTLERQLTDAADALQAAHDDASRDRLTAETRAAEREAAFDRLIGHERATRTDVEQRLAAEIARREALDRAIAEMRSAAADAEQRFREEIATLTARARDEKTHFENQFAKEREAHKGRQTELLNEIRNLEAARGALDESLASVREQMRRREIDYQHERDGLERARLTAETEVRRLAAQLAEAKHTLDEARRDFQQTLDRVTGEHADSLAKLEVTVAEREARIEDVEKQLDERRLELRRHFQHAPLALWRCTPDGALTDANRALADLVGYRQPDELRGADFVKTVFESTEDLAWLIERCLSTKTRQSVETPWNRRNGERLVVRLSAVQFAADMIEIAVEDVTNVRVLEDRLARAHRMEAVARLASEIAITCGRLLRDVHQDGQQWLMSVSDDTAFQKRGDRLLGEVARAASYLERLAAHGDEQTDALKPVELNKVLRDLKPVLKHVAGDDVELELSKTSSTLNVDMKADRVERLLVNLASYGRERMPGGGRLKIELATVVVDQKFIADHPNVRRGHHALITVTAMRRAIPTTGTLHTGATERTPNEVVSEKPGVDLGALQELLQECGGHLWLTVDPPGNMVVKLRLPLRVWDDRPHPSTSDSASSRKRAIGRWFRH